MIETLSDLSNFESENISGDWILYAIPEKDDKHPVSNFPIIIFIRNISTGRTYYYSLRHPDSIPDKNTEILFKNIIHKNNNIKWTLDKKSFEQMTGLKGLNDVNFVGYLEENKIITVEDYNTPAHNFIRSHSTSNRSNLSIPLLKHKEMFDILADDMEEVIENYKVDTSYLNFNSMIIETLEILETQGIFVDIKMFKNRFGIDVDKTGIVRSQYYVYTSTGRPSNKFDNINYAALNHKDGTRKCFRSRYGNDGRMVLIDYTTFFPRIICELTNYKIPIETDIYEYLAKLYFRKNNIDEVDIQNSKKITFRQLFGGVEDEYSHIKYLSNLKDFINNQWNLFQKNGYIFTPFFKRKITTKHISDPNPPKLFNYILQASEGEIAIPQIRKVLEYLDGRKTKAVLYTYDSVLYDFHKDDGYKVLQEIRNIMNYEGRFPMKTYIGDNYHDMIQISI